MEFIVEQTSTSKKLIFWILRFEHPSPNQGSEIAVQFQKGVFNQQTRTQRYLRSGES